MDKNVCSIKCLFNNLPPDFHLMSHSCRRGDRLHFVLDFRFEHLNLPPHSPCFETSWRKPIEQQQQSYVAVYLFLTDNLQMILKMNNDNFINNILMVQF